VEEYVRGREKGTTGLAQIMPEIWTDSRARYGLGPDPYNPHDNILAGAAHIRELHDRCGTPGFLAAYNAGPRRYENHLATGRSSTGETQDYVATLVPIVGGKQIGGKIVTVADSLSLARSPLFVVRTASNSTVDRPPLGVHTDRLLSDRAVVDLSAVAQQSSSLFKRPPVRFDRNDPGRTSP